MSADQISRVSNTSKVSFQYPYSTTVYIHKTEDNNTTK